jgi:Second Messenger Oligonucleotide or Dinucleotide Synthetase domain
VALADWFQSFCSNLQIRDGGTISTRYGNITKRLNTDFWSIDSRTLYSLYVGSYGRNTAIAGFSDMDIVFQLPSSEYMRYSKYIVNGQSALLQSVKRSIEKTYSTTKIRADGQVIQIPFQDGIIFELVPAFANKDNSFTYPDANNGGQWKTTNPRPEIRAIRDRNIRTNGNLVQLCRMMRDWKNKWSVPIGGLLLDTLAYQFIESWEYRDNSFLYYDFMCRDFFKWMAMQDENQTYWRALGSGQYVWGKGIFQFKAKRCYTLALEAIAHETATPKREWSAKQKWREIFTTNFPD